LTERHLDEIRYYFTFWEELDNASGNQNGNFELEFWAATVERALCGPTDFSNPFFWFLIRSPKPIQTIFGCY
jgi:hypothetical protein